MFDVGGIFASLGFNYDDRGADQFERRYNELEHKPDIKTHAALDVDQRGFSSYKRSLQDVDHEHANFVRGSGRVRGALGALFVGGAGVAAAGVGFTLLAKGVKSAVGAFEDSEVVARRQDLVIKTMGQDAGATAEHVNKLAASLGRKAGMDDDLIISGANVIRTFKNIRNEAGAGNAIFDRTTKAAVDLSAAFGTDLQSAAIQLGKALDDPARGASALSRTGAIAKEDVEKLQKAAEAGTPKLELQRRVLEAVEKQVKGTAAESATGTQKMSAAWGNLLEVIGSKVAPAFNAVAGFMTKLFEQAQKGEGPLVALGRGFAVVGEAIGDFIGWVGDAIDKIVDFVRTDSGFRHYFDNVKEIVGTIGRFIIGVFEDLGDVFHDIGPDLETIAHAFFTAFAKVQDVVWPIVQRILPGLGQAFHGVFVVIRGAVRLIAGLLSGDFGKAWDGLKDVVGGALDTVVGVAKAGFGLLRGVISRLLDFMLGGVTTMLDLIEDVVDLGSHLPLVGDKFKGLADKLNQTKDSIDDYRKSLRGIDDEHDKAGDTAKRLAGRVDDARRAYREATRELNKHKEGTDAWWRAAGKAKVAQDHLVDALRDQRNAQRQALAPLATLAGNVAGLGEVVAQVSQSVGSNVNAVLARLGANALSFTISHPGAAGATVGSAVNAVKSLLRFAGGGIPNPGSGNRDDHILIAPDGRPVAALSGTEGILNDPQMGEVDRWGRIVHALGLGRFDGLGALWRDGNMRHYAGGGPMDRIGRTVVGGGTPTLRAEGQAAADTETEAANSYLGKKAAQLAASLAGGSSTTGLVPLVLRALAYAREHGWHGSVTSGLRSTAKQQYLWDHAAELGLIHNVSVAQPGTSNHERGRAVDVSDWQTFLRIMSSAPARAKLLWLGPRDPVHFSVDGHRLGGLLGFAGGGKMSKKERARHKKQHQINVQEHAAEGKQTTRGEQRSLARLAAGTGINGYEQDIQDLETTYGQRDRAYGLSDEDLIVEHEDGSTTIDEKARGHRERELLALFKLRQRIAEKIKDYQRAIARMIKAYKEAIGRLERALRHAGGRGRGAERQGYRDLISDYSQRIRDLRQTAHDLGFDLKDNKLDMRELSGEFAEVVGTQGTPASADTSTPDIGAGAGAADTGPDIAEAVAREVAAFDRGRQELFANYGSNFIRPGQALTPTQQVAGFSYYGAGGSPSMPLPANLPIGADAVRAAREGGIHIEINGQDLGHDPFAWTEGIKHELTAA